MSSSFYDQVYEVVRSIPKGKVTSYGRIAAMLGAPSRARQVGYAMSALRYKVDDPDYRGIPWQRVVNSKGYISIRGARHNKVQQAELLQAEGVEVSEDFHIDMEAYLWQGLEWEEIKEIVKG
jgi:methylated-DNA-protein-cysteine methyltransferase-like protein